METEVVAQGLAAGTPLTEPARPLPVVAGDLALDLVDTVDDPWGPRCFDHVGDAPGLVRWAGRVGLLDEAAVDRALADVQRHPRRAAERLRRAHALRATLGSVFGAVADGGDIPAPAWDALRAEVAEATAYAGLRVEHDQARLVWEDDLDGVLRRVAYAAHLLLTGDRLHRVKRCAGCPWLYLDQSKNLSRRWCAMDDCGKNVKMQRYVERRAARRTAGRIS